MTTVVEINGGVMVEAYRVEGPDQLVLIDWDDAKEDGAKYMPVIFDPRSLDKMPTDTREILSRLQ